ncbi:B12-binding domain-containing radical SAM protein [Clostridium sp. CF011]|uniref:B12-binding domain-containing radical SAM protein n=1 Tax=Clostridium sp. CF011 TaxID=2843318 RepID=UPI001C0C9DF6|nr:radical SAM protein [Clostridium sp. CF011]MBU3093577.1 B12-binding domain-containing radical SAM protein [Clostridium sp. CF011]WAG71700.1 B12-binding domain-containing radical SAM protein [Clostridium sp. CF011]
MKVLLVQPPVFGLTVKSRIIEPLALEILAATIKDNHIVKILDLRIEDKFEEELLDFNPDVISFTCYICQVNFVKKYLKVAKKIKPSVKVIVGGEQPTHAPEDFNLPEVDYISMGDGDRSFPSLIRYIEKKDTDVLSIPGVVLVNNGKLIFGAKKEIIHDLSISPIPARELTEKYRSFYKFAGWDDLGAISTSRGCMFRCNFCTIWKIRDGITAHFPIDRVITELKMIKEKNIYLCEAHSFQDIDYMKKLYDEIVKNNINKNYMAYVRVNTVVKHIDLLREWKQIGLKRVFIGIETVTDNRLDSFNKATSSSMNENAVNLLHDAGIEIMSSFIIDFDFDENDFRVLGEWVKKMNLTMPVYNIITPLPGNDLYENNRELLKDIPYEYFDFNHALLQTKLPKDLFYKYVAQLYRDTYSNELSDYIKNKLDYDEEKMKKRKMSGELLARNIEMNNI